MVATSFDATSITSQNLPIKDEKRNIKNEAEREISRNPFVMSPPFGSITESKMKTESTTTEAHDAYIKAGKIKKEAISSN